VQTLSTVHFAEQWRRENAAEEEGGGGEGEGENATKEEKVSFNQKCL
jgi:hypothetical protein